jgi:hypothetical protein
VRVAQQQTHRDLESWARRQAGLEPEGGKLRQGTHLESFEDNPWVLASEAIVLVQPPLSPAWVLAPALALLYALLSYALWPHRRRSFPAILLLCLAGQLAGQGWQYLGLPSLHVGEGNVAPAVLVAAALQPLASRLPIHFPKRGDRV